MNRVVEALDSTPKTDTTANRLLWVFFGAYFTFGIVLNVVGAVIPIIIQQYRLNLFSGGLLAFAFYIAFGLVSIPAGVVADRIGAKPVVCAGLLLMLLGCAAVPLAGGFLSITIYALMIGSGIALLQTAGNPLIERLDRPEKYHQNLTLTIGFCGVGAFAGPLCLSMLRSHNEPWQRLYIYYAVLCAILLALMLAADFPPRASGVEERTTLRESISLLGHPVAVTYCLAIFSYVGAEVGTASWIVKYFQAVHHTSDVPGGHLDRVLLSVGLPTLPLLTVSLFWGLQGLGRLTSGPVIQKFGARLILRMYAAAALGSLGLAMCGSVAVTAIGFAACGFFTSVLFTLLFSGAISTFKESRGALSGLLITASIGGAITPPLMGLIADHVGLHVAMGVPALCFTYVLAIALIGKAQYEC